MACIINLKDSLSGLAVTAVSSEDWRYNGWNSVYNGDADDLTQFTSGPASPPEELPAPAAFIGSDDLAIDYSGHTAGYYSYTYRVVCLGDTIDTNIVVYVATRPSVGTDETIYKCVRDSAFNLWDEWDTVGTAPPNAATSGYGWLNQSLVNGYSGYTNVGLDVNITNDLFDPGASWYGTFDFIYQEIPVIPSPFNYTCSDCVQTSTLEVIVNNSAHCVQAIVPSGFPLIFILTDRGNISAATPGVNFPHTYPWDLSAIETDIQYWIDNTSNIEGTAQVQLSGSDLEITIFNTCVGFQAAYYTETLFGAFTQITCP